MKFNEEKFSNLWISYSYSYVIKNLMSQKLRLNFYTLTIIASYLYHTVSFRKGGPSSQWHNVISNLTGGSLRIT